MKYNATIHPIMLPEFPKFKKLELSGRWGIEKMQTRLDQIESILNDLKTIRKDPIYKDRQYAIDDENIDFFKSTKSVFSYVRWLVKVAKKLDSTKLLVFQLRI